jgi:Ca2+-binding EF-hand superfamily protein
MTHQLPPKRSPARRTLRKLRTGLTCATFIWPVISSLGAAVAGDPATKPQSGASLSFGELALQLFDADQNGRLDAKERATATRALLARGVSDPKQQLLRQKALEEFDANNNGKLERQEIRAALQSVNASSETARPESHSGSSHRRLGGSDGSSGRSTSEDSQLAKTVQRQIMRLGGMDAATAKAFALGNFDLNGDGVLDHSELMAAEAALQQYAQAQTARQLLSVAPLTLTTPASAATGTSGSATPSTSTGSSSSQMCSGSSSASGTSTGNTSAKSAAGSQSQSTGGTPFAAQGGFAGGFGGGFAPGSFAGGIRASRGRR